MMPGTIIITLPNAAKTIKFMALSKFISIRLEGIYQQINIRSCWGASKGNKQLLEAQVQSGTLCLSSPVEVTRVA